MIGQRASAVLALSLAAARPAHAEDTPNVAESEQVEKTLLFLPGQLPSGVEPSDDPMIDIRNGAHVESFSRRNP